MVEMCHQGGDIVLQRVDEKLGDAKPRDEDSFIVNGDAAPCSYELIELLPCIHPYALKWVYPWGNVCPARARRATFLLTIPTSAPNLPSHGEAPQVDHIALHTFPTKHVAK